MKDNHSAAIPDGETLEAVELSARDKEKLKKAKGVEVKLIDKSNLEAILKDDEIQTTICYFWTLNSGTNNTFGSLRGLSENPALDVILVNMDDSSQKEEVNIRIRASGIDADIYMIGKTTLTDGLFSFPYKGEWPAYFIYNREDETGIWFEGERTSNELSVLIQPFII